MLPSAMLLRFIVRDNMNTTARNVCLFFTLLLSLSPSNVLEGFDMLH
jgi:hypothetical protein